MAIAAGINWIANSIVAFSYPLLDEAIGGYTFFIFSALVAIFIAFTFFTVPETKGKTVPEIQAYFQPKVIPLAGENPDKESADL